MVEVKVHVQCEHDEDGDVECVLDVLGLAELEVEGDLDGQDGQDHEEADLDDEVESAIEDADPRD